VKDGADTRAAFVTGAAQGVGRAIARELLDRGLHVVMADRDGERNSSAASELDAGRRRAHPIELDVRDGEASLAALAAAEHRHGPVDVLVNNAAVTIAASLWEVSTSDWDDILDTNLRATFVLSRAAAARMRERRFGRIVNLASLAGQTARPSGAPYAASKAGIVALTRVFALELAPHGVTVNAIAPGVVDTPMVQAVPREVLERLVAATPVGRIGTPEEVAALAAFLASDEAGFITGATYDINGGTLMR
jgi:3-oxoacyl-[acyl-carrier protein] reductase